MCHAEDVGGSFWNLSVFLTKCVEKFPDLMLSINLEYFLTKNEVQDSIIIQSSRNQTVTGDDGF